MAANLKYRKKISVLGFESVEWEKSLWMMCARDPLFFLNTFCWTYNPKDHPSCPILPFITWGFQDTAAAEMLNAFGKHDLLIKKTRDMGASWLGMYMFLHQWLFRNAQAFGVLSKRAEEVDRLDNPKSLFWKLDFAFRKLPKWLRPDYTRTLMHFHNNENESSIDGEATTPDAFRGDRRTALWLDEFPTVRDGKQVDDATADVSVCRLFVGTSRGTGPHFHKIQLNVNVKKLWLGWQEHPHKAAGLYVADEKSVTPLDKDYEFPVNYPFVRDGKKRSPWYDKECNRRSSKLAIAQEIDGDDLAAGGQWFEGEVLKRILEEDCSPALIRGDLYQREGVPGEFQPSPEGRLHLWKPLAPDNRPQQKYTFVFGVDWSAGSGASNSSVSIGCLELREKIGEYTRSDLAPESFAEQVVALAKWFNEALVCPERNGPGSIGIKKMQDLGYSRLYYGRKEESIIKRESDVAGWSPTNPNREYMLGLLRSALGGRRWTIRSPESILEAQQYVRDAMGYPVHSDVLYEDDPAGAKMQHGDRVIADGLCYLMAHDEVVLEEREESDFPDLRTVAGRRKAAELASRTEATDELGDHWRP